MICSKHNEGERCDCLSIKYSSKDLMTNEQLDNLLSAVKSAIHCFGHEDIGPSGAASLNYLEDAFSIAMNQCCICLGDDSFACHRCGGTRQINPDKGDDNG